MKQKSDLVFWKLDYYPVIVFPASLKLKHEWVFFKKVTEIFYYLGCSFHFLPKRLHNLFENSIKNIALFS